MTDIELYWHGESVSPELEYIVVTEIRRDLLDEETGSGLSCAADLMFHHIKLGPDWEGPGVKVWGKEGDHRFHCEYHAVSEPMKFEIDDIPGFREKLVAAGHKFEDETDE